MTGGTITAKRVILATGGRSVPKTGSDGHGYALARRRGRQRSTIRVTFAGDCQHVPPRVLRLRLCRNMRAATFALLLLAFTLSLAAGEPSPIEDHNFMLEVGRNRDNAVLQYNTFFFRGASALELAQEWAVTSPKHQLGYAIPLYSDAQTGLGDVTLNYRYQLFGEGESRIALAPRVSLILPTRNAHFGERSSGVQVNLPFSAAITSRLATHTNAGATWFFDRGERELNLGQSIAFDVAEHMAVSVDAAYTRCGGGSHLFVVRPGVQFSIDGPRGLSIAPGVAFPTNGGVLVYVALEHPFN